MDRKNIIKKALQTDKFKDMVKKMKPKNKEILVNKINSTINSIIKFTFFINIILIFWVIGILVYLNRLADCKCFQENNKTNMTYLKIIEYLLLFVYVLSFISICPLYFSKEVQSGGANDMRAYLLFTIFIEFLILGFFIYYVCKLKDSMDSNCECTKSWLKNLLYIQTIVFSIHLASLFFLLFAK